jgi:hypothetical protein
VVQSVENVTTIAPSLGLGTNYPFSLERITVTTPAGSAGKTDVVVSSGAGTVTSAKSFQYLQVETFFAKPALEKFIFYDQQRRWLYLSNIAQLEVFDLAAGQFRAAGIQSPGSPPNAGLRGLALTPDSMKLVVADFGAQNAYLINPDDGHWNECSSWWCPGLLELRPGTCRSNKRANRVCRFERRGRSGRRMHGLLGTIRLDGKSPDDSARATTASHSFDRRSSHAGQRQRRSRVRRLWQRSGWATGCLECYSAESIHHDPRKRHHRGHRRGGRRNRVRVAGQRGDGNSSR